MRWRRAKPLETKSNISQSRLRVDSSRLWQQLNQWQTPFNSLSNAFLLCDKHLSQPATCGERSPVVSLMIYPGGWPAAMFRRANYLPSHSICRPSPARYIDTYRLFDWSQWRTGATVYENKRKLCNILSKLAYLIQGETCGKKVHVQTEKTNKFSLRFVVLNYCY